MKKEVEKEVTETPVIVMNDNMKNTMYNQNVPESTGFDTGELTEGESIEVKLERMIANKEPLNGEGSGSGLLFTERKDGVNPSYNIRTDRWVHVIEATDKMSAQRIAQREAKVIPMSKSKEDEIGGTEPTQGKVNTTE